MLLRSANDLCRFRQHRGKHVLHIQMFYGCCDSYLGVCHKQGSDPGEGFQEDLASLECVILSSLFVTSHWAPLHDTPFPVILDQTPDQRTRCPETLHLTTNKQTNLQTHNISQTKSPFSWRNIADNNFVASSTWILRQLVTSRQLLRTTSIFMLWVLIFISITTHWQLVPGPTDQWGLRLAPLFDTDADV